MKLIKSNLTQLLYICIALLLSSCDGEGNSEEPPVEPLAPPLKAVAVLPENGEPCSVYEEVANDDSKVLIAFKWNAAQSAQNYILTISEGATEVFKNTVNTLETKVQLDKCKAYTWLVISKNEDGQTNGDTFSFTTPGTPIGNYAPYAAIITIEFDTETSEMLISWEGNDKEDDQLTYDVTVWENASILIEEIGYDLESINPISYKKGENYVVKVVSKDSSGDFSVSTVSEEAPE